MHKKYLAILVVLSLVLPITSVQAATKAGGTCKKIGLTTTSLEKKYECKANGKKLVWVQIVKPEKKITATTKNSTEDSGFNLTIAKGYSVDIVDLDMVNKGKIADFSVDYIQKVNDAAPQYAQQYCEGLLQQKSEVIVKDGMQTLGVSYFKPTVVFSEKLEKSSNSGGQYLAWSYVCFLQADFTGIKKIQFYEVYVNGVRIATEPYANLLNSKFRLLYPNSQKIVCITGTTQVMSGLLSCR